MKNIFVALFLVVVVIISLAACGVDYEAKGYKDMKSELAKMEAEAIAEQGEEAYRATMQLAVALFGRDIINLADIDPAELTGGGYDKLTTEQKTDYLNGAKRAVEEWIDKFVVKSDG